MNEIETVGDLPEEHDQPKQAETSKVLSSVQSAIAWAYDAALGGIPGLGSAEEFAESYVKSSENIDDAIGSIIGWQTTKAATAGFVTGLGGIVTLPVAIPANLASTLYIQLRMIAAIAKLRGYDIRSDQVKTLCIACLAGSAVSDILKDVGIKLGTNVGKQAIAKITGVTIIRINQAVGFRLVTKAGSTGIVNLTKMVPFIGGVIGGSFDAVVTRGIGAAANSLFTPITKELESEVADIS